MEDIKYKIKEIIVECLELDIEVEDIEDNEELFGGLIGIDSISTMMIIDELESEFDIEVLDDDISAELFESVNSLHKYVNSKLLPLI